MICGHKLWFDVCKYLFTGSADALTLKLHFLPSNQQLMATNLQILYSYLQSNVTSDK
jgi:hypothetical protein